MAPSEVIFEKKVISHTNIGSAAAWIVLLEMHCVFFFHYSLATSMTRSWNQLFFSEPPQLIRDSHYIVKPFYYMYTRN